MKTTSPGRSACSIQLQLQLQLRLVLFSGALFAAPFCWAGTSESCAETKKIDGVLATVAVPCAKLDRLLACTKVTRGANGSTLYEDVPCGPGEQRTVQQAEREQTAAQRRKCGRDFQAMRIGMKLDRYEECTDGLVFVAETVAKGGVIETWRSTFYLIQAQDGRIVAYTRQ